MQNLAAQKRFAYKYYYQLDCLKLSTDQKQYFNRVRGNITLKYATLTLYIMLKITGHINMPQILSAGEKTAFFMKGCTETS